MKTAKRILDTGSLLTIIITLTLFVIALFLKGFSHDLLLEGGVFLVSVKLVLMSYKNSLSTQELHKQLDEILEAIKQGKEKAE